MAKKSTRRAAPKKLRAVQTSRHFRIAHSRHTGHITPHRTTSYPVLAMILLIVGVLMYGWSGMVNAVQYGPESGHYVVRTSVKGTAPTTTPTIIKPNNGSNLPKPRLPCPEAAKLKPMWCCIATGYLAVLGNAWKTVRIVLELIYL